MLRELRIKDFALIDELSIQFGKGLNVLTGSTGAGKSIIVGAIGLLLGERAERDQIRSGSESARVEGLFELAESEKINDLFPQLGIKAENGQLVLGREIFLQGPGRCYANGKLITLSCLRRIGDLLIDLHGPHQHQSLLQRDTHLDLLDGFGGLWPLRKRVESAFKALQGGLKQREGLIKAKEEAEEKRELHSFQLREIERINPQPKEEEDLEEEKQILENTKSLTQSLSSAIDLLYETEGSALENLQQAEREIEKAARIDRKLEKPVEGLRETSINVDDVYHLLTSYLGRIEHNPQRLEEVTERLFSLKGLEKRFGGSIDAVLQYKTKLKQALGTIEDLGSALETSEKKITQLKGDYSSLCFLLSQKRREAAKRLEKRVEEELAPLGMEKARFEVRLSLSVSVDGLIEMEGKRFAATEKGMEKAEFYISPNPGEELKPLTKIASLGEASRIMLALKAILAKVDQIPLLVFDEIDVGIGGKVAHQVGARLKLLASSHQVICITHLQQIASQAQHHYKVEKATGGKRTKTSIRKLTKEERINEIARMLAGKRISPAALEQAQEMIREGERI